MKKFIQKFTALITCTTLMMSISSKVYADSYTVSTVDNENVSGITLCDTQKPPIKVPFPPNYMK